MKKPKKSQEKSVEKSATDAVDAVAKISTADQAGPEEPEAVAATMPAADDNRAPETAVEAPEGAAAVEEPDGSEAEAAQGAEAGRDDAVAAGAEIEEMVRQAYLRGRNEAIEALMRRPGMMQPLERPTREPVPTAPEGEVMILNNPRPSIWDR